MLASQRTCGRMLGLIFLCSLGIPACRQDSESYKAPSPTAPAVGKVEETAGGDKPAVAANNADAPTIAPADAGDAPGSPAYLPTSEAVSDWVKHEPVRVAPASNALDLLGGELAERLRFFRYTRVARCGYARYIAGQLVTVDVQAIEADSPSDAYGIMSVLAEGGIVEPIGGETRVATTTAGGVYSCWQGKVCLRLICRGDCEAAYESVERLLMQITAGIHREDLPQLMEAIPLDGGIPAKRWLVRRIESLPLDSIACVKPNEIEEISKLLGLGPESLMCVAAYRAPEAKQDNVVWLVQYSDATTSAAAYERYMRRLEAGDGGVWESTNLMPPHGRHLIGTWTVAEESMQYVMPRIEQLLPVAGPN